MNNSHHGATTPIIVVIWVSNNISVLLLISSSPSVVHRLSDLVPPKLIGIIITHICHQVCVRLRLVTAHLAESSLILTRIPVHHKVRIIIEDNSWNDVTGTQLTDKVSHCMPSHIPLMPMHRSTDIQSKKNCVVLLHGYLHHPLKVRIGVSSFPHSKITLNSSEHGM